MLTRNNEMAPENFVKNISYMYNIKSRKYAKVGIISEYNCHEIPTYHHQIPTCYVIVFIRDVFTNIDFFATKYRLL